MQEANAVVGVGSDFANAAEEVGAEVEQEAEGSRELEFVRLQIISHNYPRTAKEDLNRFAGIYVPLSPIDQQPFVLGVGGFASVFLAFDNNDVKATPLAVKLLRKERGTGTQNGRQRFIEEIFYSQLLSVANHNNFVEYRGFGYLRGNYTTDADSAAKERSWVLAAIADADVDTVKGANDVRQIDEKFLSEHQDLFLVMNAAWFSLEQLLVSNQPLRKSNSLKLSYRLEVDSEVKTFNGNTIFGDAYDQLNANAPPERVRAAVERLAILESSSGLEILSKIRCDKKLGSPVATRAMLQIFVRLVASVRMIHQFEQGAIRGLSHRDLKPANFLIDSCQHNPPAVLLSDLGFIAAQQNGKTLYGAFGRIGDPGVLPQGSVMFQAPEQMLSGREVSFELVDAAVYRERRKVLRHETTVHRDEMLVNGKFLANAIRIRTVGGIEIEPDDRVLCNDISLRDGGDGGRMVIKSVEVDPMYPTSVVAFIGQVIEAKQTVRTEYKGTLLKPVGQHSDLFSLGCLAYFIASGGKDPSEFYRTYLRPASGLIYLHGTPPRQTCFDIAKFLGERSGTSGQIREVRALATAIGISSIAETIAAAYAKIGFGVSKSRDHYLFSTDGEPIGLIFLYLATMLMCRGIEGSYVKGGPTSRTTDASWETNELTDLEDFLTSVTQQLEYQYADVMARDPFQSVWENGLNALVRLRLLASATKI